VEFGVTGSLIIGSVPAVLIGVAGARELRHGRERQRPMPWS
jgi:hypothetical protein